MSTAPLPDHDDGRYRSLFEQAGSGIMVLDLQERFMLVNPRLCNMLGYSESEMLGLRITDLQYDDDGAAPLEYPAEMQASGAEPRVLGRRYRRNDGAPIWLGLSVSTIRDANGAPESLMAIATEISEHRQTEVMNAFLGALRAENEQVVRTQTERREVLGAAATALLTSDDPDTMLHELFDRIASHLRIDQCYAFKVSASGDALDLQTTIGVPATIVQSVMRIDFGEGLSGTVAMQRTPMVVGSIQQSTEPYLATTRRIGLHSCACFPLIADGRLLATVAFGSTTRETFDADEVEFLATVSRYVAVAFERLRLISELRKADRQKDDFIALLAHELRNPLAPLRNGLAVLRLAPDGAAATAARDMMDRQLAHLVRLIEDLLDVSRITLNKLTLRRQRVLLSEVMNHAVETARPAVEAAGHALSVQLPAAPVYLYADLTRLAQVFSNLLTNSAKYTAHGGHIAVHAKEEGETALVSVSDDGIGIPREALPGIFNMFSQIDSSIERTAGGLGIGLALVKGLVGLHGGSVSVTSEGPGMGAVFTVRLPVVSSPDVAAPAPSAEALPNGPRRRVLVVDDNRDAAASMKMVLELLGNDVLTAHDGIEAVAAAAEHQPDLVMMDVGMPRLNGYDATRRIRATPGGARMTIVALTGWGQESDRQESREAGCDRHLVKPVNVPELQQLLADLPQLH